MLLEQKTTDFLEQLSSSAPIPGGGGASAAVGAFASALGLMVTNLTVGKKKYADVEEEILEIREKLEQKKQDLVRMVDEDAEAFEPLAKAYRMPKETEEEQAEKEKVMEAALKNAAGLLSAMQELQSSLHRQPLKELLLIFLSIQR